MNPNILEEIKPYLYGTPAQRKYVCERVFVGFVVYYFTDFLHYPFADFHWDMYDDVEDLEQRAIRFLVWLMFRESAKTTLARIYACYLGCYGKKKYINYDAYEKENSEAALFDIALWFQTNKKLVADFGQLYFEAGNKQKKSTMKRINNFVLSNGVKYEAHSTQESLRGRLYQGNRPDALLIDDFETNKTKRSAVVIKSIIDHLDEAITALGPTALVMFLCNYITDTGAVQYILDKAKNNPSFRVRRVDAEDSKGNPSWKGKYAKTDLEAGARNVEGDPEHPIVSLESKKRDFGKKVYATEMMNSPEASGELVFDRAKVDAALAAATEPLEDRAGFKVWAEFNPKHRYAIGADTSKGIGRDACASVLTDFTPIPALITGTYANNTIAPDTFGHELKREGDMYGTCLLAPEVNNQGYATVTELKHIYPIEKIYRPSQTGKTIKAKDVLTVQLGFDTNPATRPTIIFQFKSDFESGHIKILDRGLLLEMRAYGQADLQDYSKNPETTRHFDKLIAACISWNMKDHALLPDPADEKSEWRPPAYEPISSYEGTPQAESNNDDNGTLHPEN